MPTQSDMLLMENYSSSSQNRIKNNFGEVSVRAEFTCDDVSSERAEGSRGKAGNNKE
jgi:hypothetical protein